MLFCKKIILSLVRLRESAKNTFAKTHLQKHCRRNCRWKSYIRLTIRVMLIEVIDINVIYYRFLRIFPSFCHANLYHQDYSSHIVFFFPNIYLCIH